MAQLTTFVFTDLVGSVTLKKQMPGVDSAARDAAYVRQVLTPHREKVEAGLSEAEGRVVSTAGDGHFIVFPDSARAALWALDVLRSHAETPIAAGGSQRVVAEVRIGMHSGTPQADPADPDNFIGRAVDYAARLAEHAQGGQVLVSRTTAALIEDGDLQGVRLHSHGPFDLRGIGAAELYEVVAPGGRPIPPRPNPADAAPRSWSVLPRTMGLTEYSARSGSDGAASLSSTSAVTALQPRRLGNYEVGELLGAGGMGNVYKARHAQFDRPRAIKIIRPELVETGGESVVQRFYKEVRATGALEHPNLVVAIDSSSPDDDEHYLVMEYIDGVSLDRLLEVEGPLSVADACEVTRQAALGLAHLHEQGLVHRDVKPSNLMLTLASSPHSPVEGSGGGSVGSRGSAAKLPIVKLMDLGLALLVRGEEDRVTRFDRGGMGTAYYMPPEQWISTTVDIRADLYSLGCTLHHLLMGEPPYARSDLRPERAHATEAIPPLRPACGAPRELTALVERMLAKDPDDRPQTPLEVVELLQPFAAGNRLAERIERFRSGATSPAMSRADTRPDMVSPVETNTGGEPRLRQEPTAGGSGARYRWVATLVASAIACAAMLMLYASRTAMLERHRVGLIRTASFAANIMATEIDARQSTLEDVAEEAQLRTWLKELRDARNAESEATSTNASTDAAKELQRWLVDRRSRAGDRLPSSSWFITDETGKQIARSPPSARTMGEVFAYRDYFHGRGPEYEPGPEGYTPLTEAHQSRVYQSKSRPEDLKVAFSMPVYDGPTVVGVVAMSVVLGDFKQLDKTDKIADLAAAEIVLVDAGIDLTADEPQRGLILHHRDLIVGARLSDALLNDVDAALQSGRVAMLPPYRDLLGRGDAQYWGAVAPVNPEGVPSSWVVIAQEPQP